MKRNAGLVEILAGIVLLIVVVLASCQPETVIMERKNRELVPVTPEQPPEFIVVERGELNVGTSRYTVYKVIDEGESQICTFIKRYSNMGGLSCRPMTLEEISEWK